MQIKKWFSEIYVYFWFLDKLSAIGNKQNVPVHTLAGDEIISGWPARLFSHHIRMPREEEEDKINE